MVTIVFAKIYLNSEKLPINCAAWSDLKHAQQNIHGFPMRFFLLMGRNVPIIIEHSYVSWGTFLFFREGRTE